MCVCVSNVYVLDEEQESNICAHTHTHRDTNKQSHTHTVLQRDRKG